MALDRTIRVMVVEDSLVTRRILSDVIGGAEGMSVDWTAVDGVDCLEQLKVVRPDVITLDVEMPNLDGIRTLEEILRIHGLPVVMISSHTRAGAKVTLDALDMGAVDFVAKPASDTTTGLFAMAADIVGIVRHAAGVDMDKVRRMYRVIQLARCPRRIRRRVLVLGASTGGPRTLQLILQAFPSDFPLAVLVAQHMPEGFTRELAGRLNSVCRMTVAEARDGDLLAPGKVLVAPGGVSDMVVERDPGDDSTVVRLIPPTQDLTPQPSIDVLMTSVAAAFPDEAIGVLLTGMGADGARGMERLMAAGAITVAESEESCIIFGMPKKAIELGAASIVAPKDDIARIVVEKMAF